MKKIILVILCLVFSLNAFSQQERFVKPVDEASQDASFKNFRDRLIRTVKRKNKAQLLAATDKNIKVSFGMESGIKDFQTFWKMNSPNTKIWEELLAVLENGGIFFRNPRGKTFCAPYLFTTFPDDLDAFEYSAIFGKSVNLREKPNLSSKVLASLSYNVVKVDISNSVTTTKDINDFIWLKINTLGGRSGYVSAKYVRSSIDYRACFDKKRGRWKMTVFVAGD